MIFLSIRGADGDAGWHIEWLDAMEGYPVKGLFEQCRARARACACVCVCVCV